jgi:hypothetical protein
VAKVWGTKLGGRARQLIKMKRPTITNWNIVKVRLALGPSLENANFTKTLHRRENGWLGGVGGGEGGEGSDDDVARRG